MNFITLPEIAPKSEIYNILKVKSKRLLELLIEYKVELSTFETAILLYDSEFIKEFLNNKEVMEILDFYFTNFKINFTFFNAVRQLLKLPLRNDLDNLLKNRFLKSDYFNKYDDYQKESKYTYTDRLGSLIKSKFQISESHPAVDYLVEDPEEIVYR